MIRVEIDKSYKGNLDPDIEDLVQVISKELELLSILPISKELDIVIKVNDSIEVLGLIAKVQPPIARCLAPAKAIEDALVSNKAKEPCSLNKSKLCVYLQDDPLGIDPQGLIKCMQCTWNPNPFYNKVLQELRGYYLSLWIDDCINNNLIPKEHIRLLEGRLGYGFEYSKLDSSFSMDNYFPIVETRYQESDYSSRETRYIVLVSSYSPYADLLYLKDPIDFNPSEVTWIEELTIKSITNDNPFSMFGINSTRLIRVTV